MYKDSYTNVALFGVLSHNRIHLWLNKIKPIFTTSDSYYSLIDYIGPYIFEGSIKMISLKIIY